MAVQIQQRYTSEEYLALERRADYKSEYFNGWMFAMAGASEEHNLIAGNVFAALHGQFRGRTCRAYVSDMRVKVSETGLYTYPDVVAVCGERRFEDVKGDTLLNPTLIVEVLSASTEAYDRGDKFGHYLRLESLQEYVMIAQDKARVEHYVRQGEHWLFTESRDLEGVLQLVSIGCSVPLREIYDRVEFPTDEGRAPAEDTTGECSGAGC
jgi:Uma2 family endonuclease